MMELQVVVVLQVIMVAQDLADHLDQVGLVVIADLLAVLEQVAVVELVEKADHQVALELLVHRVHQVILGLVVLQEVLVQVVPLVYHQ
jgi:hypothetical protein